MNELERRFHETWLGMVQPTEGLVVSVPVLVDAQCMARQLPDKQHTLRAACPPQGEGPAGPEGHSIADLAAFFEAVLELTPDLFDAGADLPEDLALWVPEGRQTIRPTLGLRTLEPAPSVRTEGPLDDSTPPSRAGLAYVALVWDVAAPQDAGGAGDQGMGLPLGKPETHTGAWDYPPAAKFDRLLRHCRVPIGILTNREVVRLVYAPHGASSGHIDFRIDDMASVGGRPILDAFMMLLSATRFFGVSDAHALPGLLAESRTRQLNVTDELADQVFEALQILLRGFEAAAARDGVLQGREQTLLDHARLQEDDHLYHGVLTVLLRLVVLLYAEDRELMPVGDPLYAEDLSVLGLFDRLQRERGAHPDSMSRRYGAWAQLIALFRSVYLGVQAGTLSMPPRRGKLFDPNTYAFLEGWDPDGSAPVRVAEHRAAVRLPSIDDETVYRVLERLLILDGQRLSYRTLDVEQIGGVYEAMMGYHVIRLDAPAVCLAPDRVWMTVQGDLPKVSDERYAELAKSRRSKWIKSEAGLSGAKAKKLMQALDDAAALRAEVADASGPASADDAALDVLAAFAAGGRRKRDRRRAMAQAGQLVLQPGAERRRTSAHYTPKALTEPIVRRTLEPLLTTMAREAHAEGPRAEDILALKVCDPAMGSGAFLVEACRFLGDQLVAAWTREGQLEAIAHRAPGHDPVQHARRLVAQRCLYGVDKNESAVELAKLSLWLLTMSASEPFSFLDGALRHGDSLVGLDFEQILSFHWTPGKQLELLRLLVQEAMDEVVAIRERIGALADDVSESGQREKERLVRDADDATDRVHLVADVCVGAFFAADKAKAREKERLRRLDLITAWLGGEDSDDATERETSALAFAKLQALQDEIRERIPVFHWGLELPEVFYAGRPDPLAGGEIGEAAAMDAFVGNPPFIGGRGISGSLGDRYLEWLMTLHAGSHGNADLSAHFFLRADHLLGDHGTIGLIATNTIAQGDTRTTGLKTLVHGDCEIYEAMRTVPWPGAAAVTVAVVHLAKGRPAEHLTKRLDGEATAAINSRLRPFPERDDPTRIVANGGMSFQGAVVRGMGFTLSPEQRQALINRDARNAERIFAYLGGKEVNTSPTQSYDRYVINFGAMPLTEAERWPDLISILREKVKPERDRVRREAHKKYWWHYGDKRPALYEAIAPLDRCLVTARVTKHLMFSFQPTDRVFSEALYVFPLPAHTSFAVLQSRIHEPWTRLLSSSLGDTLRYSATDCFETFPFPEPDPRTVVPAVEAIGQALYDQRAAIMLETEQGLTKTYNALKDPDCTDAAIMELRALHEQMDSAVLAAYGWEDLEVPPYCPATRGQQKALEAFSDEVVDRLFVLNAERAEDEVRRGLAKRKGQAKSKQAGATKKRARKPKAAPKKPAPAHTPTSLLPPPLEDAAAAAEETLAQLRAANAESRRKKKSERPESTPARLKPLRKTGSEAPAARASTPPSTAPGAR